MVYVGFSPDQLFLRYLTLLAHADGVSSGFGGQTLSISKCCQAAIVRRAQERLFCYLCGRPCERASLTVPAGYMKFSRVVKPGREDLRRARFVDAIRPLEELIEPPPLGETEGTWREHLRVWAACLDRPVSLAAEKLEIPRGKCEMLLGRARDVVRRRAQAAQVEL